MKICELCQQPFATCIKIDDKWRILGNRKYCLICSPYKKHNTKKLYNTDVDLKQCFGCKEWLNKNLFYSYKKLNKLTSKCKECNKKDVNQRALEFKKLCVEYKGGKCIDCGYCGNLCGFDFHHRNSKEKDFVISRCNNKNFNEEIKKELDKCDLLCAICHRIKHSKNT